MLPQINQQRTKTVNKNTSPEYSSLLHFPQVERADLSRLHMHIAILGRSKNIKHYYIFISSYVLHIDEDISGDHLLAEARVSLVKIFPQLEKQFQVCLHRPHFKVSSVRLYGGN